MAFVDFSNAVLHLPSSSSWNVLDQGYAELYYNILTNLFGQTIVSNYNCQQLEDKQKRIVFLYTGTFTTSGTEFYLGNRTNSSEKYKMTGITFNAGDAYSFQIPVTLTCLNNQLSDVPEDELIPTGD